MPAKLRNAFDAYLPAKEPGTDLENARLLPLAVIVPNARQARQAFDPAALDELAASIRQHGVLEPILVRPVGDGQFQIVAGERRYRAADAAGRTDIPALIRDDLSEVDAAFITALENLQRQDLDIEDEARQFTYLLELTGLSQRKLAEQLGIGYNYLSRRVRLLERPDLLTAVHAGTLPLNAALAQLSDDRTPPAVLIERDTLEAPVSLGHTEAARAAAVSQGHKEPPAPAPVSQGHTAAGASTPRWRYVEEAYRPLKRIQPQAIPAPERTEWVRQLRELSHYAGQLAQAIEAEEA